MLDPVMLFREGGPWMYLILMLGVGLSAVPLAMFVTNLVKIRVPAPVWLIALSLPLLAGLVGTITGARLALDAIAHASAEIRGPLAANGLSVALYTTLSGAVLSAMLCVGAALAQGLGSLVSSRGEPPTGATWTPAHASGTVLVLLSAGPALLLGSPGAGLLGLGVAVALIGASARLPADDWAPAVATSRGLVAGLGLLGLACLAVAGMANRAILYYSAIARASAEVRQQMMASAFEGAQGQLIAIGLVAAAIGLAGLVAVAMAGRHLAQRRTLLSAEISAGVVLLLAIPAYNTATLLHQLHGHTLPYGPLRAEQLEMAGLRLPWIDQVRGRELLPLQTLQLTTSEGVTLDGAPASPDALELLDVVQLEAEASAPLRTLAPYAAALHSTSLRWAIETPEGLRSADIGIAAGPQARSAPSVGRLGKQPPSTSDRLLGGTPTDDPPRLAIVPDSGGWAVLGIEGDVRSISHAHTHGALERAIEGALQQQDVDRIDLWLPPGAIASDLIALWALLPSEEGQQPRLQWRTDTPPEVKPLPRSIPVRLPVSSSPSGSSRPPGPGGSTHQLEPTVMGTLSRDAIRGVVQRHMNSINYCYLRELTRGPGLQGKIEIKLVIASDGSAASANVSSSTMGNASVEQCIVGRFMRMRFPEPTGGGIVIVSYPFTFSPG